jgi:Tfp pilus assembly protein PilW
LVEVLLALFITGFVLAGAIAFFVDGWKTYYKDEMRLTVNADLRKFTTAMETDAAFANNFYIYDLDTNPVAAGGNSYVTPCESGDLVLLVNFSTAAATGVTTFTRIVAYYRTITDAVNNAGPVYRYDTAENPAYALANGGIAALGTTSIDSLYINYIKDNIVKSNHLFLPTATVIGKAINTPPALGQPAAPYNHANLFYYLSAPSTGSGDFMVLSAVQEYENNQTVLAIDTYNFTVWPRS